MRKKPVHMFLKQSSINGIVSREKQETIYRALQKRCERKAEDKYIGRGVSPSLLRLYLDGTSFNSTVELLVKVGSYKVIFGNPSEGKSKEDGFNLGDIPHVTDEEIGFEVTLKSFLTEEEHILKVWRQQFKAYIEVYSLD